MTNHMQHKKIILLLAILISVHGLLDARIITSVQQLRNEPANSVCEIIGPVDLKGESVQLNPGITLEFKSGYLANGTLVGNKTSIKNGKDYFRNVTIKGSWLAPVISTSMFSDLSKVNDISNVIALTNPEIYNVVTIEKGVYWVDTKASITIDDNTNVILEGTIRMKPNAKVAYDVVLVKGQNVVISGRGEIIGDREEHLGEKGEWGMGINLYGAKNVVISGITISNCWGDGIYVYGDSENVSIFDCSLKKCRRQGISVTEAKNVSIQRCVMSGIGGTLPGLGIDIEPHKNKAVENVYISDVIVKDSEAGVSASNSAKGSVVGEITIRNSSFYGTKKNYCVSVNGSSRVVIDNCYIESGNSTALVLANINTAVCLGNTIVSSSSQAIRKSKCVFVQDRNNSIIKRL